ncbi:hypothetical protein [Aestuariivivens sp. NBU2969]|uniref:hypothetical protein n=1 Tax=Aestuariivivens sp. NBU2969 TaxID=2873267 RepID=UPI001CBA8A26|nr:hypothetical protein [Aestuariivivens sp. NBU2969]
MLSRKNINSFIFFFIILLLWQCKGNKEEDIRLITFKGSNVVRFLDFSASFSALDSLGYGSLLMRKGELLAIDEFVIAVNKHLADTISVHQLDSLLFINGNLTGISIAKNSPPLSFFNQLSEEEISHLKTIQFEKPIWDSMRPYLKKMALLNPNVDIVYFSEMDSLAHLNRDLLWVSQNFNPRALLIENKTDSISFSILAKFLSLETLMISVPTKGDGYIPHLPHLKEIILVNNGDSTFISPDFFRENHHLESVKIIDYEGVDIDWNSLNMLKKLKNLYIESDSINLNAVYEYHPHLKFLNLRLNKQGFFSSGIFKKNKLKWFSLYATDDPFIGQNTEVFQDSFPELEYLEFENNDSLLDYRNFKNLKNLKYLIVSGKVGLDSTLHNLDHLRYLSLSDDFLKDSVNVMKVKQALPNTIITPNSGACLGSGWLLLIIPLAGLWFYFLEAKKT